MATGARTFAPWARWATTAVELALPGLGATEAHGPNAPIGEDIFLVTRMAEAVAERTGCTVSEPLWWGSHPYHHLGIPGTVVIPEDVFTAFVRAMIAGFWNMGFRKQILLNGHGQEYVIPTAIHQFGKALSRASPHHQPKLVPCDPRSLQADC